MDVLEVKHWVPQLFYAEAAEAIKQREGGLFSNGRVWLTLCAGAHSDGLAAMLAGYAYVPIDIEGWVVSFGKRVPNVAFDMTEEGLFEHVGSVLGGKEHMLRIAVVSAAIPCETHSILNPGKHRDPATGEPWPDARGHRARQVDAIQVHYEQFLLRLSALRTASATGCMCGAVEDEEGGTGDGGSAASRAEGEDGGMAGGEAAADATATEDAEAAAVGLAGGEVTRTGPQQTHGRGL